MVNRIICNCENVSYFDVEDVLNNSETFQDVEKAFKKVQQATHCSTGCGGCHDKVLDVISELLMGGERL